MESDLSKIANELKENGYSVVTDLSIVPLLHTVRSELIETMARHSGSADFDASDAGVLDFWRRNSDAQFRALQNFRFNVNFNSLASHSLVQKILSEIGFTLPTYDCIPNVRCDMPTDECGYQFAQHQDWTHNLGSLNSVTFWIPLQDVPNDLGPLEVAPRTHKLGALRNNGGIISDDNKFDFCSVPMKLGDILIFDQLLVHRSGFNSTSNKIRFSVQLRISDMSCQDYASRDFKKNFQVVHGEIFNG